MSARKEVRSEVGGDPAGVVKVPTDYTLSSEPEWRYRGGVQALGRIPVSGQEPIVWQRWCDASPGLAGLESPSSVVPRRSRDFVHHGPAKTFGTEVVNHSGRRFRHSRLQVFFGLAGNKWRQTPSPSRGFGSLPPHLSPAKGVCGRPQTASSVQPRLASIIPKASERFDARKADVAPTFGWFAHRLVCRVDSGGALRVPSAVSDPRFEGRARHH